MSLADHVNAIRALAGEGKTEVEIAAATGLEIGDVATVLAAGVPGAEVSGSSAGSPVVRKFPFAFDTPNLSTGHTVYTPAVGDILLDAWIQVDVAWDGPNAKGDVGAFFGSDIGWFNSAKGPIAMNIAAQDANFAHGLSVGRAGSLVSLSAVGLVQNNLFMDDIPPTARNLQPAGAYFSGLQVAGGLFVTNDPIKVVVSQDGTPTGGDPGSLHGEAVLYLVTATPV